MTTTIPAQQVYLFDAAIPTTQVDEGVALFAIGNVNPPAPPVVSVKEFDAAFYRRASVEAKEEEGNSNTPFAVAVVAGIRSLPGFKKNVKSAIHFGPMPEGITASDKELRGCFGALSMFVPVGSPIRFVENSEDAERATKLQACLQENGWQVSVKTVAEGKIVITGQRGNTASAGGPPPPPPPPVKAAAATPAVRQPNAGKPIFEIELDAIKFPDGFGESGSWRPEILGSAVRVMTGIRSQKTAVPLQSVLFKLGRLRALLWECDNAAREPRDEYEAFVRTRALEQLYGLGWTPPTVGIPGLAELIAAVEAHAEHEISAQRRAIQANVVTFDCLAELYLPGSRVVRRVSGLEGEMLGMLVRNCWYEEHKTLFGPQRSFHISLEFFVSAGNEFVVCTFDDVLSDWTGPRATSELDYQPLPASDTAVLDHLRKRGDVFAEIGIGTHFMECPDRNFIPRRTGQRSMAMRAASRASTGVSRVMIDNQRGIGEGAMALVDGEPHSYAVQAALKGHRFLSQQRMREDELQAGKGADGPAGEYRGCAGVFRELPPSVRWRTWPAVVGFNFACKAWGMVVLESLQPVRFQDTLLERLVLGDDVKMLVRAFVAQNRLSTFNDVLAGKRGASVVLMHGPPGVGKTLTAEAMAESFHKPLYPISMGELGESSREVEQKLGEVLELCAAWDCIMLIDEADTILEKRDAFDIAKNAVVCVMLRLLEYHDGVVFLTTNRVDRFDPAVLSRVTISIAYNDLEPVERERVWRLLLQSSGVDDGGLDVAKVAEDYVMNGREIKNALRLAMALAADQGTPLSHGLLTKVVEAVLKGKC